MGGCGFQIEKMAIVSFLYDILLLHEIEKYVCKDHFCSFSIKELNWGLII